MTESAQQRLRPKRYSLGVGGLTLFGGGGCLMWTIVLIPVAIPIALFGLVMMIASAFIKTEPFVCPKCGQPDKVEKDLQVTKCPQCETVVKRDESGWAVLFALLVIVGIGCGSSNSAPDRVSIRVTAADLFKAYAANEVAADQRFKDKWIDVSGTIDDIGKDILDTPYVTFSTDDEGQFFSVQAMFVRGRDEGMVARLQKGRPLTVRCRASGKLGNVLLRDCAVP